MRRLGLRFLLLFAFLQTLPFPLTLVPGTRSLIEAYFAALGVGVRLLATLLGLPEPMRVNTGSGDTLFAYLAVLVLAIAAAGGAAIWSGVARTSSEARLVGPLRVWLRFFVAVVLFWYGVAKVFEIQFQTLPSWVLDQRIGDKSPMGFMWAFMGHSRPYTIGAGLLECIGSILLVWRRTATIGALILAVVMANVVAMNFSYDVPVKLWSLQLLAGCLVIAGPDLRRMLAAALGHAVREAPLPPRAAPWVERVRGFVRCGFLAVLGLAMIRGREIETRFDRPSELDGTWNVTRGGGTKARLMIDDGIAAFRTTDDQRVFYRATVDPVDHSLVLRSPVRSNELTYEWIDRDHFALHGTISETRYDLDLERAPAWLLETRGFHWIQEEPFHR